MCLSLGPIAYAVGGEGGEEVGGGGRDNQQVV